MRPVRVVHEPRVQGLDPGQAGGTKIGGVLGWQPRGF
jgi:hypothetical protein